MAILTKEMKQFVREQRLGFIATVCPDNTPNLSPKGTLTVWDNEHLVFADIRSPGTIGNLRLNRSVERRRPHHSQGLEIQRRGNNPGIRSAV